MKIYYSFIALLHLAYIFIGELELCIYFVSRHCIHTPNLLIKILFAMRRRLDAKPDGIAFLTKIQEIYSRHKYLC